MSFDADTLTRAIATHGPVARVVVAEVAGSAPREAGAAMLVWPDGQAGTIGGGALEYQAAGEARAMLSGGPPARVARRPLGPALGQCCGGAVTLVTEVFAEAPAVNGPVFARPVEGGVAEMPLEVRRLVAAVRAGQAPALPRLAHGWLVEAAGRVAEPLWIWGAGHVGRALVHVLAPLPDFSITWIDTAPERFPGEVPQGVSVVPAAEPAVLVAHAPADAHHLILTYSHALDLDLCHRLLSHGFASAGLIGSASKWARFRRRLSALGHRDEQIAGITCPIGDPLLGKHPAAIAVGVAARLLSARSAVADEARGMAG